MSDVAPTCRQCGSQLQTTRGRCSTCGALIKLRAARRAEMQHALMREFDWFDWTGELLALGLLALVVAHVLPAWTLLVAVLFILRPMARVTVRIAAGLLGA